MSERRWNVSGGFQQTMSYEAVKAARMNAFGIARFNTYKTALMNYLGVFFNFNVFMILAENAALAFGYEIDEYSRYDEDMLILWVFENFQIIGSLFLQNANTLLTNQEALRAEEAIPPPEINYDQEIAHFGNNLYESDNERFYSPQISQFQSGFQSPNIDTIESGVNEEPFAGFGSNQEEYTSDYQEYDPDNPFPYFEPDF